MTDIYVRSTDGDNASNGLSWANAKLDLAGAAAIDAAGDTIFVSDAHAESTAGAVTVALAGTVGSPTRVICGDDAAEPPTSVSAAGSVTTTGTSGITITGFAYVCGLTFNAGTGAGSVTITLNSTSQQRQVYEGCTFSVVATGGGGEILTGVNVTSRTEFLNCGFKFASVGHVISPRGIPWFKGGGILAGTTTPSYLIEPTTGTAGFIFDGFDFSNLASTFHMVLGSNNGAAYRGILRSCKLPAGWSGNLFNAALTIPGPRVEMYNCDSGDTNYRVWIEDFTGSIKDETTLVRTGGASDGDTPLAWKMATSAQAKYPLSILRSPEIISEFIDSVGAAKTITVEILHDSATNLKDDEVWIEVQYQGTSGAPLSLFADDAKADVLATAADQASSAATWTTTGMTNPNKQKLEVTFTPEEKGVAIATVCLAKASKTIYVDPVAQLDGSAGTTEYQVPGGPYINATAGGGSGGITRARLPSGLSGMG